MIDGLTYLAFFAIVARAITETLSRQPQPLSLWQGWGQALSDRSLLVFAAVNVAFTTYLAQVQSALPVYLHQFATAGDPPVGISTANLSLLFTWHVLLSALLQLPVARRLSRLSQPRGLMLSAGLWSLGFGLIFWLGTAGWAPLGWAAVALAVMALATTAYTPIASSLVVRLAPASLRGVYLSVNSMCWAVGYFIGPLLGGWSLDQGAAIATGFWLGMALTGLPVVAVLASLERRLSRQPVN